MPDAPHLLTELDGAILIATLNRPEKLNALSGQLMELFEAALHRFACVISHFGFGTPLQR